MLEMLYPADDRDAILNKLNAKRLIECNDQELLILSKSQNGKRNQCTAYNKAQVSRKSKALQFSQPMTEKLFQIMNKKQINSYLRAVSSCPTVHIF